MAFRNIVKLGDEILRKKSKEIKKFVNDDKKLAILLDDMKETLIKTNLGVGLAAPQVGILKRAFVMDINGLYFEMLNPVILKTKGMCEEVEGCLSVPGVHGVVRRPEQVTVEAYDRYGDKYVLTAEGLLARCILHEYDHLDGIVFTDIMEREIVDEIE
ncbi:MAG: peptide deformylase [Clostridia bacterium]|nr:peptide deformylase [Clostridia bacterium]MDD4686338.1 peptide deformylase [Clostridia bacterium]